MDVHYQVKQIEYALNTYQLVSVTFHICLHRYGNQVLYPWCSNATGTPLRNFYITHVSAFDILNPRAGDVGAKKSNGKI